MYNLTLLRNARLTPLDRGELFEDPIHCELKAENLVFTDGDGTMLYEDGEIQYCEIVIVLNQNTENSINCFPQIIDRIGISKGSSMNGEDFNVQIGRSEGLAFYLNEYDIPDRDTSSIIPELQHFRVVQIA